MKEKIKNLLSLGEEYNLQIKSVDKAKKLLRGKKKNRIIYQCGTPYGYNYGGRRHGTYFIIYLNNDGNIDYISGIPRSRFLNLDKILFNNEIEQEIKINYLTGGYTSRNLLRGKNINRTNKIWERCLDIAESHIDIVERGISGHTKRVMLRNCQQ